MENFDHSNTLSYRLTSNLALNFFIFVTCFNVLQILEVSSPPKSQNASDSEEVSDSDDCRSMNCFASSDIFVGRPERGRFATEPVVFNFLIIRTMLARLTAKPSVFNKALVVQELNSSSCIIRNFSHNLKIV